MECYSCKLDLPLTEFQFVRGKPRRSCRDCRGASRPKEYTGVTYAIRHRPSGLVKIGKAIDADARMDRLTWSNSTIMPEGERELELLATWPGDRECELHSRFAERRKSGEWFALDEDEVLAV